MDDTSLNATLITLALHYLGDPLLCISRATFNRIEPCEPTVNRAFLTFPQRSWKLIFDTQRDVFGAKAAGNQAVVEIGQRNDVFSVERHSIVPPVDLLPAWATNEGPVTQPLEV